MSPVGLEPTAYGLKVAGDTANSSEKQALLEIVLRVAQRLEPEGLAVLAAWPTLPTHIKKAIVALVGTSG